MGNCWQIVPSSTAITLSAAMSSSPGRRTESTATMRSGGTKIDVHTGEEAEAVLLRRNHAKIAYDPAGLTVVDLRKEKQS